MTRLSLSDDQLQRVREAASALLPPSDIARLLELSQDETEYLLFVIKSGADCPESRAYWSGRTETKLQLHESVVRLALKGSPAAQPIAENYLREQSL